MSSKHEWFQVDKGSHSEWHCRRCQATHKDMSGWMMWYASEKPPADARIRANKHHTSVTCDEFIALQVQES